VLSIIAYGPFVIVHGVAPRFLYTSLFFCALSLTTFYAYLKDRLPKSAKIAALVLVILILIFSLGRTWQVANRYKQVSDAYTDIVATVTSDFPTWPDGKDMLFYKIPKTNKNVLAFLTYFDKAINYGYHGQTDGKVYRAEQLSSEELEKILKQKPIIYEFEGFGKGVRRVD